MTFDRGKIQSHLFGILILTAALCLLLGIFLPVLKLTRLYIWTDTFSIASVIWALYTDEEYLLSGILFIFSILFPALKILYLVIFYSRPAQEVHKKRQSLEYLTWLGKWSMLDVLVLALIVFYVKSTGIAEASTLPGIYFFSGSVLFTMLATAQSQRLGP